MNRSRCFLTMICCGLLAVEASAADSPNQSQQLRSGRSGPGTGRDLNPERTGEPGHGQTISEGNSRAGNDGQASSGLRPASVLPGKGRPGERVVDGKSGGARAGTTNLKPYSGLNANSPAVRNPGQQGRERQTERVPLNSASIHQAAGPSSLLGPTAEKQKKPASTAFAIPTTSTLPVQPDRSVGAVPTIAGLPKPAPSAKTTAALNGTEIRHRP